MGAIAEVLINERVHESLNAEYLKVCSLTRWYSTGKLGFMYRMLQQVVFMQKISVRNTDRQ